MEGTAGSDVDEELESKRLCSDCIGEEYLSAEIMARGEARTCSYCGTPGRTISISELADRLEAVFERYFKRTSDQMSGFDYAMQKEVSATGRVPGIQLRM